MKTNFIKNIKEKSPLVHCITNYVTVNDCANILLACGGSPTMADDPREVEEITSLASALVINIGTMNAAIDAMVKAGKASVKFNHPVVLDPVGAGASKLRTDTTKNMIKDIKFTVIRGNISEIKALALGTATTKGVDAGIEDVVTEDNLDKSIEFIKAFAKETGAIIAASGAIDIVADGEKAYVIYNGDKMMSKITGSGCMLTAMTGAYVGANENKLEATAAAFCAMGIAGERAMKKLQETHAGNSSYRNYLIDEIFNMTDDIVREGARYEIR